MLPPPRQPVQRAPRRLSPQQMEERRRAALEARRQAQRRAQRNRILCTFLFGIAVLILITACFRACSQRAAVPTGGTDSASDIIDTDLTLDTTEDTSTPPAIPAPAVSRPVFTVNTHTLTNEIDSDYAVLISLDSNTVLAHKSAKARIYPASLTKVMSLIVAYEHIENLADSYCVTSTIIDPVYRAGASLAGFSPGETVPLMDLLYGMILPSGAEASVALAQYVAGSEEAFVTLMNEKAEEMGLTDTHFTNCTGLHDKNHYSTPIELSMILAYAMQYEKCARILSTYQYTTTATEKHPEGILLESTMFSRMYGDEPEGVTVIAGKTGYTNAAHHCLISYATDDVTGEAYIFVSTNAAEKFAPIFDAIAVYSDFTDDGDTAADS